MLSEEKIYKDVSFGSYVVLLIRTFVKTKRHSIDDKWVQNWRFVLKPSWIWGLPHSGGWLRTVLLSVDPHTWVLSFYCHRTLQFPSVWTLPGRSSLTAAGSLRPTPQSWCVLEWFSHLTQLSRTDKNTKAWLKRSSISKYDSPFAFLGGGRRKRDGNL